MKYTPVNIPEYFFVANHKIITISPMNDHHVIATLINGTLTLHGMFLHGSNYTFLARVQSGGDQVEAVYKPAKGEQPLWDFPASSLGKREAAAYEVSAFLGWDLIPPTVYRRRKAPLGPGSLQVYFRHDPLDHYFNLPTELKPRLIQVAVLDVLINDADRKGGHVLLDETGHLWCIDQGLCFHEQDKLRTVIWDFAGQAVPGNLLEDIRKLLDSLQPESDMFVRLTPLLSPVEISALGQRCLSLLEHPILPEYDPRKRLVPYPPL